MGDAVKSCASTCAVRQRETAVSAALVSTPRVAANRQRLTRDAPEDAALPGEKLGRRRTSLGARGDENAFQLVEKRVRAAHQLRRVDAGGRIHDACGQRRQALGADGQRASLDAMRGAAQRCAVGALERDLHARQCRRARRTPAPPALRQCPAGRRRVAGCARDRSDSRPARRRAARSARCLSGASLPSHCASFARSATSSAGLVR